MILMILLPMITYEKPYQIVFTKDKHHNFLLIINYMTTSNTYDLINIDEISILNSSSLLEDSSYIKENIIFSFISKKYSLFENFKANSDEIFKIKKVFNEMKEKASKTSTNGRFDKENQRKKIEIGKKIMKNFDLFDLN